MDIYFCDECAARVTAADLRRGFGIRKSHVVVCGSCVEEGRGAERLEKAGVASAATQPAQALVGAGVLDERRDRAETAPEDEEPSDSGPAKDYFDNVSPEDDTDPINQSLDLTAEDDGASDSAGFGAMANGMNALSAGQERVGDDVDDLEDSSPVVEDAAGTDELDPQPADGGELDDMLSGDAEPSAAAEPADVADPVDDDKDGNDDGEEVDDVELAADVSADEPADQPDVGSDSDDELNPTDLAMEDEVSGDSEVGKADTEEVPAASASSVAEAAGRKRGSTTKRKGSGRKGASTSARRKSSSGSRPGSKSTKRTNSTRTSTKRVGAVKKSNATLIYGVSAVTIGVLLTAIIYMAMQGPSGEPKTTYIDVGREMQDQVATTFTFAKEAHASRDVGTLGQAIDRIDQLNGTTLDNFIQQAESQGMSEDEMDRSLRRMKFYDLRAMRKTLSDLKFQLEQQGD